MRLRLHERHERDLVDLLADQRIHARGVVGDGEDLQRVDPRAASQREPPVVVVADEVRPDTGLPVGELEGARPVRLLREVGLAVGDDPDGLLREEAREVADRALEVKLDLGGRDLARGLEVDRLEPRERLRLVLGIGDVAQRVEDVVRRQRLAAVERHALAELQPPDRRLGVAGHRLGQAGPREGVCVVLVEALVDLLGPRRGRVDRDVPGGERIARAAVVHAHAEVTSAIRLGDHGARVRSRGAQEARYRDRYAERRRALEQPAPCQAGARPLVGGNVAHSRALSVPDLSRPGGYSNPKRNQSPGEMRWWRCRVSALRFERPTVRECGRRGQAPLSDL